MKVLKVEDALKDLEKVTDEIRHKTCVEEKEFSVGLISFSPGGDSDPKQINHEDKDVVCNVFRGSGRLRLADRTIDLGPGTLCHIPKGTPHDFSAVIKEELILIYSLIRTRP
tara:strand:+ start:59 stop:394 length:336 start_codon:yes stop_codon:yes gene_type:complete